MAKPQLSPQYVHTARGHDKALASPTHLLNLICTKAWQTLVMVSQSFPWSVVLRQLSPQLAQLYVTKLPMLISTSTLLQCSMQSTYDSLLQTALALQHLAHVRLAVQASNQIDTPPVNPTYCQTRILIYQPRPTPASCNDRPAALQRLNRPQLPATIIQLHSTTQPTSASSYDHPAAFYDSSELSFQLRSSSCIPRLNLCRLPTTSIQLRTSMTQPYQLSTLPF